MPSLRNSDQNTFFPKQAKLSESFSCTYSFQILCLEFQTPVFGIPNVVQRCLEFQTPVFGIPNIMHSCVFGIPNMHVWNSEHVVFRARFARAQSPNVQSFRAVIELFPILMRLQRNNQKKCDYLLIFSIDCIYVYIKETCVW